MWMINIFFVVLTAFATLSLKTFQHEREARAEGYAAAVSGNFAVYGNLLAAYAHANSGYSGTVSTTTLNPPTWFNQWAGLTNYVQTGTSFVYLVPATPMAGTAILASLSKQKAVSGINRGGTLFNISGVPVQPVPNGVPNGAVVLVVP